MPKKFTILWIVFGFFPYALIVEGAAAAVAATGAAARDAADDTMSGGGGAAAVTASVVPAVAPVPAEEVPAHPPAGKRPRTENTSVSDAEGASGIAAAVLTEEPPTLIQSAISIINYLLALKEFDPYLLGELPSDTSFHPAFDRFEEVPEGLLKFYSETKENRDDAFRDSIQWPLLEALGYMAKIPPYKSLQAFINNDVYGNPLSKLMARDVFNSPNELENLYKFFVAIEDVGRAKKAKQNTTELERHRDRLLESLPIIQRFAHYAYDINGLDLITQHIGSVEAADPSTFLGRLSILRALQVMGEQLLNCSPMVLESITPKMLKAIHTIRDDFVHFSKRRLRLIYESESTARFVAVKAELVAFKPKLLRIQAARKAVEEHKTPEAIWATLEHGVDPIDGIDDSCENLSKLVKVWSGGTSPKGQETPDLIAIIEYMRELAGITTDCLLEAEKKAWNQIIGRKFFLMQEEVVKKIQNAKLELTEKEALKKAIYDQMYPEGFVVSSEFLNVTSHPMLESIKARFNAIRENLIRIMNDRRASLTALTVDVDDIIHALREMTRAERVLGANLYNTRQSLKRDLWRHEPSTIVVDGLSESTKKPLRDILEGFIPIICRQLEDVSLKIPGLAIPGLDTVRRLGNYYAHPKPGQEKPMLGIDTSNFSADKRIAWDGALFGTNLLYFLQNIVPSVEANSSSGGGAAGGARAAGGAGALAAGVTPVYKPGGGGAAAAVAAAAAASATGVTSVASGESYGVVGVLDALTPFTMPAASSSRRYDGPTAAEEGGKTISYPLRQRRGASDAAQTTPRTGTRSVAGSSAAAPALRSSGRGSGGGAAAAAAAPSADKVEEE